MSSIAFEIKPEIESSLDSASVLILPCFLALESKIFCVLCMTPEPKPSRSPVEARTMLIGKPTLVVKVTTDAISRAVIAVITEVSLIFEAVARRLNCFARLSLFYFISQEGFRLQLREFEGKFFRHKHLSFYYKSAEQLF